MRTLAAVSLLLLAPVAAFAQRDAKIPDPDPEIERKSFVLPEGFEVNLFAADPMLAKPIQMNFDPQGRLWVAASEVYPQIKPGQAATDRVLILEDTNGDGKADKTTVFADGLLIPTGLIPGDGGAYVADSTDIVHFSDPDPATGKARKKRIVLSGFGTEDTHHIIHTFRWGPECLLYFNQSVYIHSHIETPHGVRRLNAGGIWQFRPETERLEVFARGWWNSWGNQFDRWGTTFTTDGAGGEGINYAVPGAYYAASYNPPRILPGLNPGSPKDCGLEIVSGRHFPDDWQGNLITNDFRGHRVCRYVLKNDGAGFQSLEQQEVIKSNHPAFRPIDVAIGPDGALYIADWYNPIIQHGEVDFRDPRRDKTHGRIWRVTAKGRPLVEKPKLVGAEVGALLAQLESPEQWTRLQAKRVLKELGAKTVEPELAKWVAGLPADAIHQKLEALWLYQALDVVEPKLLETLLTCPESRARASASRVTGAWASKLPNALALLTPRAVDDDPLVRLEAVRALVQIPTTESAVAAAAALDKPVDRWLDYAIFLTLRELAPQWLPELKAGKLDFGGNPKQFVFALQASGSGDISGPLQTLLKSGKLSKEREAEVWELVARTGGSAELGQALAVAVAGDPDGKLISAIESSVRTRKVVAPGNAGELAKLIATRNPAAIRLVGLWKLEKLRANVEAAANAGEPAGFEAISLLGGPASKKFFEAAAAAENAAVRRLAIGSLVEFDAKTAATKAADLLAIAEPSEDLASLFAAFSQRKGAGPELARALQGKKLPTDVAKIGVRVAKAAGQPDAALIDALTKSGGIGEARKPFAGKELETFLADVANTGDAARGEAIYRRTDTACQKCHAIAGAGGLVGPDFSSIGASAQADYLIESLLAPNAKIKEGYHSVVVNTLDGKVVTGIKLRENKQELVLRDADDKEIVVPIADIDSRKDGKSLMPDGLTDPLTRAELVDLTRFLSELGKGKYAASPGKVVRRWQTVTLNKELFTLTNRDRVAAVANPKAAISWVPAYSWVSGDLPLADLPKFQPHRNGPAYAVARFQIDVSTGGKVQLGFPDPTGLAVWLDGNPLNAAKTLAVDVEPGIRTVTVAVDTGTRTSPLRAELDEVPGSPARAKLVGGK